MDSASLRALGDHVEDEKSPNDSPPKRDQFGPNVKVKSSKGPQLRTAHTMSMHTLQWLKLNVVPLLQYLRSSWRRALARLNSSLPDDVLLDPEWPENNFKYDEGLLIHLV